ncbi:Uncharacterised protein [Candidatus Norongarragalina meridionalis]|nr:Uncharacterised protein [Candidatus Norongarragalina meridionalis]
MRILGVAHVTTVIPKIAFINGKGYGVVPTGPGNLRFVSTRLRKGSKTGIEGSGVEGSRFFQGVGLWAKRKGARLVSLESSSNNALLSDLHGWLLNKGAVPEGKNDPEKIELFRGIAIDAVGMVPGFSVESFARAVSVYRSILMFRKAKEEGCDTLVVGAAHAQHMQLLGFSKDVQYSKHAKSLIGSYDAEGDVAAYKRYLPLLKKYFGC